MFIGKEYIVNPAAILLHKQRIEFTASITHRIKVAMRRTNLVATDVKVKKLIILRRREYNVHSVFKALLKPPRDQPFHVVSMDTIFLILYRAEVITICRMDNRLINAISKTRNCLCHNLRYLHDLIAYKFLGRNAARCMNRSMSCVAKEHNVQPFAFVQEQTIHYLRYELFNSLTANICIIVIPNVVRHKTVMPISKHNNSFVITAMNKFFLLDKRLQFIQTIRCIYKLVFKVLFPTELIHELIKLTALVKELLCLFAHLTDFHINLISVIAAICNLLAGVFLFKILHDRVTGIRSRGRSLAQAVSVNVEVKRFDYILPVEIIGRFLDLDGNQS